jgi:hypothetical protein
MDNRRTKLTTRVDANMLAASRRLAQRERRPVQALIDEALVKLIEARQSDRPRARVMQAYRGSLTQYADVYKKLVYAWSNPLARKPA